MGAAEEAWFPPVKSSGKGGKKVGVEGVDIITKFKDLLGAERGHGGKGRCLSALRKISHLSPSLVQDLWVSLFGMAWQSLPSDECRRVLVPAMETMLARPFNRQSLRFSRKAGGDDEVYNVVGGLLKAFLNVTPLPKIDLHLLGR